MEMIVISTTKLKVMLSAEDMKKLDFDPCGGADISDRVAFRNILKEARERCGFDALGDRVFVQYYPEKHGGCEMFVTKIILDDKKAKGTCMDHNKEKGYIIYSFDNLGNLLSTCRMLLLSGYTGESLAYVMGNGKKNYYLLVEHETYFAPENCGKLQKGNLYYVLTEHGMLFCGNAVKMLGKLA